MQTENGSDEQPQDYADFPEGSQVTQQDGQALEQTAQSQGTVHVVMKICKLVGHEKPCCD